MPDLLKFTRTTLTGGGATAVDGISATALVGNELCWATVSDIKYLYRLNPTSGAAPDGVNIIIPVVGTVGDKRWILQGDKVTTLNGLTLTAQTIGWTGAGGTTSKTLTVTADTSLDEAVAMSSKAPKASPSFTGPVLSAGLVGFGSAVTGVSYLKAAPPDVAVAAAATLSYDMGAAYNALAVFHNSSDGLSALYFLTGNTCTEISDPNNGFSPTDVGTITITKASGVITMTNNYGVTKGLSMIIISTV